MLWLWGLLGCWSAAPSPEARAPLIVVVTMDTVSAHRVSLYGYERPTTPRLDRFATEATTYKAAYSSASWTLPAHGSLFTGQWPHEHRGHKYRLETPEGARVKRAGLPEEAHTLAEHLAERGWSTGAFVANPGFKGTHWGLHQGFGTYEVEHTSGVELAGRALSWLAQQEGPSLLFLNVMEAHVPYACDHVTPFSDGCEITQLPKRHQLSKAARRDPELMAALSRDHDAGIVAADRAVGALLDGLETAGRLEDAVVAITSDHGELFGEHGIFGHGRDVYNPLIEVPLVLKTPGGAAVDEAPISLVHVPRLLLEAVGVDATPFSAHWPRSTVLAQSYFGNDDEIRSDRPREAGIRQAVMDATHKLLASEDGERTLVEAHDRVEKRDLSGRHPEVRARLEAMLPSFEQGVAPDIHEDREALRELGYVE